MTTKIFKLNNDKIYLIAITTHNNTSENQNIALNIGIIPSPPTGKAPRNIGVLFYLISLDNTIPSVKIKNASKT